MIKKHSLMSQFQSNAWKNRALDGNADMHRAIYHIQYELYSMCVANNKIIIFTSHLKYHSKSETNGSHVAAMLLDPDHAGV